MPLKLTKEEFIQRARKVHGDKYDYSLVEYKNAQTKIKIICPEHGVFEQTPAHHIHRKQICRKCAGFARSSTEDWIKKAKEVHGNKYDYSLVEYKNNYTKVKIICSEHGVFEQNPNNHISKKRGCAKCVSRYNYSSKEFIENAREIHGDKYDYSLVEYKNAKAKVKIICPEHGLFEQNADHHINHKSGCPTCSESKGEREVRLFLENNNINYKSEHIFKDLKYKNYLKFDFYLLERNICIEYDGIQHFKYHEFFGGKKAFKELSKRDEMKTQYCKHNNIQLIRIRYDENVEEKLKKDLIGMYE